MLDDVTEIHGEWGSLAVGSTAFDVLPMIHDGERISVVVGDPVVHGSGASALLDAERRRALHRELAAMNLGAVAERLDGHFAILTVDERSGAGAVITDRFAFVGLYHGESQGVARDLVIGTHVDAVARAAGGATEVDLVSATDMVLNLSCTFPFTLYDGVRQAGAGATRSFVGGAWVEEPRIYWAPQESPPFTSFTRSVSALREGLAADARAAISSAAEVGLLLSGGEDSRAVLGALPAGKRVRAFIYADWESREVRIARAAARAYGAEMTAGMRTPDHYLSGFDRIAPIVGSAHLFMDVHGYGFHETLGLRSLPVVLGGLSADSLVKAEHAPAGAPRRRPVPVPDEPGIRDDLKEAVIERRTAFRDLLARIRPETADEWISLWPFSMRKHGGNVDGNRRLFRTHECYHANAVLDVAARTPRRWKEHRRLFREAMRPFLRRSWLLPHTEYRFPYFGPFANAALFPLLALARGVRAVAAGEVRSRHRPWPKWSAIARSERMRGAEDRNPLLASPIAGIVDSGFSAGTLDGWYALRRLMLLQLAHVTALARN